MLFVDLCICCVPRMAERLSGLGYPALPRFSITARDLKSARSVTALRKRLGPWLEVRGAQQLLSLLVYQATNPASI